MARTLPQVGILMQNVCNWPKLLLSPVLLAHGSFLQALYSRNRNEQRLRAIRKAAKMHSLFGSKSQVSIGS